MIKVQHVCTKAPGASCPLVQLNDDGTTYRCTGCVNDTLEIRMAAPASTRQYAAAGRQELTPGHLQEV